MKVGATSDLHGNLPKNIDTCDLFLIAGDIVPLQIQTNPQKSIKWLKDEFIPWCIKLPCNKVVFIAGNHDFVFEHLSINEIDSLLRDTLLPEKITYLKDNSITYNGITIYGTPWCTELKKWAFYTKDEIEYSQMFSGCDIILSHQPPMITSVGIVHQPGWNYMKTFASYKLADIITQIQPKYSICGHVHTGNHVPEKLNGTTYVNVSLLDEDYKIAYDIFYFDI